MFNKKQPEPIAVSTSMAMRETLFGDVAWERWATRRADEPWKSFAAAHEEYSAGYTTEAIKRLRTILATPGLESRHYLQAWHFLRQLGETPEPEIAKHVYGAVIEVGMPDGLDLLAAYDERTARYWNFSGAGIVWDNSKDMEVAQFIIDLLDRAEKVVQQIGPWSGQRPPAPGNGVARLNILVPGGLHFGQAPVDVLSNDPLGGAMFQAGARLMNILTLKAPPGGQNAPNKP